MEWASTPTRFPVVRGRQYDSPHPMLTILQIIEQVRNLRDEAEHNAMFPLGRPPRGTIPKYSEGYIQALDDVLDGLGVPGDNPWDEDSEDYWMLG